MTQDLTYLCGRGTLAAKRSPKEIDYGNGMVTAHEQLVTAHEQKWTFVNCVDIDAYNNAKYKPKLNVADPNGMSESDYWMLISLASASMMFLITPIPTSMTEGRGLPRESCTR